jgi:hypothetical protein
MKIKNAWKGGMLAALLLLTTFSAHATTISIIEDTPTRLVFDIDWVNTSFGDAAGPVVGASGTNVKTLDWVDFGAWISMHIEVVGSNFTDLGFYIDFIPGIDPVVFDGGVAEFSGNEWEVNGTVGRFTYGQSLPEVPVPAAAWLFGSALLGLGVVKRKKA